MAKKQETAETPETTGTAVEKKQQSKADLYAAIREVFNNEVAKVNGVNLAMFDTAITSAESAIADGTVSPADGESVVQSLRDKRSNFTRACRASRLSKAASGDADGEVTAAWKAIVALGKSEGERILDDRKNARKSNKSLKQTETTDTITRAIVDAIADERTIARMIAHLQSLAADLAGLATEREAPYRGRKASGDEIASNLLRTKGDKQSREADLASMLPGYNYSL